MKKLTQFSVNYPITILMFVLAVILLGYISFSKLGIDLLPDLNNPKIFVEIQAGERPPEEIEKQFVESIESLAIRQKKVTQVSSVTRVGSAQITVEYTWDADMDEAFLDLQKTLTSFSQNSELDELIITQHDPNAAPVMLLGLSHSKIEDMDELRKVAENYLRNELVRLEGIAEVELIGQEEKEVVIETNAYLLEAYNLTPSIIASRIQSYNRNASGGSIVEMGRKYIIKGIGEFQTVEDIGEVIVTYKQPEQTTGTMQASTIADRIPVYLKEVGKIYLKNKDPENIVRINRTRCMGLAIYKETKFNTVQAVEDLLDALVTLRKALPGYELTVIQNQGEFITQAIDEVKQTALIGILLAVVILFVFLRRLGTTFIISLAIPISIIATFNLMYFKGLTLNIMTLGGLALGAGMLVDNAIVVMENIFRNLESGLSLKESAIVGTSQVGGAITASTITTIVVFLPIVYLHGAAGELFKDQAWTVAFSLLSSLIVAILVIPMLSTRILKNVSIEKAQSKSISFPRYSAFLTKVLDRRWLVIGVAATLVIISILLIPIVGSEFVPKTDLGEFAIELKLPEGTELKRTEQTVDNIENIAYELLGDNIHTIYSKIGPSTDLTSDETSIFEDENTATLKIILNPKHSLSMQQIINRLSNVLEDIPDLQSQFIQEQTALQSTLGTETAPIVVEVKGEDLDIIQGLTDQVKNQMLDMEDLFNVETTFDEGRPEVDLVLDRVSAGLYNVGINDVSSQLQDILLGRNSGQWEHAGELKDITLRLPEISINQLEDLVIVSGEQKIRLNELVDIKISNAPKEINRRNQVRIGKITAHLKTDKPFDHVVRRIEDNLTDIDFPTEYKYEITGEEQKRKEAFDSLKFALILSIILVYMVMASQFESLIHPFTILLTIPLAAVGAILIFFFLGKTLNIMAFIGMIMLAGIAVNDSIILVDAINQLKREGLSRIDAIIEAGQRRIRPIIMTSLTTILALLPLTFGFGEGAALRAPMALAVIGGLITSTILTLFVIPCVYSVLDQLIIVKSK
ncbi:efflux RND transporter permease subunit [candidate division KSB1 bacterium]|nr:efflux RND transporter permease subunit [candidate division KSB1 bacterium]